MRVEADDERGGKEMRKREKGREKERKKRRVNVSEWLHEVAHILMDGHSILLIREETNKRSRFESKRE